MTKTTRAAAAVAAPLAIAASTAPEIRANLRVVDAATGEEIARVITADAEAGTLTRFAIEDGNLVREGDAFVTVEESREIRIKWIEAPAAEGDDDGGDA